MITLELNLKNVIHKIELQDEILFNSLLCQNEKLIKKIIKTVQPLYKINDSSFEIINRFVEVTESGNSLYGGLIVRTAFDEFAVLFLENTFPDDDYIIRIIGNYLHDVGENISRTVTINKIEIDKTLFLKAFK